jgi:hypothetical protein
MPAIVIGMSRWSGFFACRALDLVDDVAVEDRAFAQPGPPAALRRLPLDAIPRLPECVELGQYAPALSTLKL